MIPLAEYEGGPLRKRYYNFIYQARYNEKGIIDGILVFAYDVSDQVKARRVIEENARRFRFMANAMPQKVWTASAKGEINYFNEQWKEYTGLSFDELKSGGWRKVVHPEDLEEKERKWKNSVENGLDYQFEHRLKRKDGQYRWHLSRGVAHREEDGAIRMWIGTNTDIHDQKMSEQALQELTVELKNANQRLTHINVDLDNFIYTASHDLKAPIINIEGLLSLLRKKLPQENLEQEQVDSLMEMMQNSVERFKRVVSNLTDITKLQKEADQGPSQVSIPKIIQEVILDLGQMVRESDAQFEVDIADCSVISFAEKNLRSILYNLISNAIKYRSPERTPQVRITCKKMPDYVVLKVQDNGLGIDLRQEEKLFSMFRRLHTHVEGSGIGLFMVKRIIENSGGKIKVDSRLGEGSTFSVYFRQ